MNKKKCLIFEKAFYIIFLKGGKLIGVQEKE